METIEIRSLSEAKKGNIILLDDKHYEVIDVRRLLPFLGEQDGFLLKCIEIQ
jgi:hypothetical protein